MISIKTHINENARVCRKITNEIRYSVIIIAHRGPVSVDFVGHITFPTNLRPDEHAFIFY
jgi:hypothetical protein